MNNFYTRRSFIFTPPLKENMFEKAIKSGSDIVCLELEDGIALKDKLKARNNVIKIIKNFKDDSFSDVERIVRINSPREINGLQDINAILATDKQPDGIMIPKVKNPEEILLLDNLFSEKKLKTTFHVIIETNEALENAYKIANCSKRIRALFFGGVDMSAELRCENVWESLLYARSRTVHAAASAGIDVIDVPFLDLSDSKGMKKEAIRSKKLGFSGKGAIHPKQIPIINKVFTPNSKEISNAKKIISVFEKSKEGLIVIDNKLIEKPVLREMYRLLNIEKKLKKI